MSRDTFIASVIGNPRGKGFIRTSLIAARVAMKHKVKLEDVRGDCRARQFSYPRQEVMYEAIKVGLTPSMVGRYLKRDHTTVLHGAKAHQKRHGLQPVVRAGGLGVLANKVADQ